MWEDMVEGEKVIPFVRQFYGSPSKFFWEDDMGTVHQVCQGEGGEQGDPLMPLLFSLGQHRALVAVQSQLRADEKLFAFLDDVYVVCKPDRAGEVYKVLEVELRTRACINIHKGKTKLWNAAGVEPTMAKELTEAARDFNPQAVVWRGDPGLPPCQQGLTVLGAPVGNEAFICNKLREKGREHERLLRMIPHVQDVQAAWLLLFFCASTRANFLLRTVQPEFTEEFAQHHDDGVMCEVIQMEGLDPLGRAKASLPLTLGGLGLASAIRIRDAAH